ncbi:MAG: hypothetical protein V7638_4465 [Acidobacteriota bacterium]
MREVAPARKRTLLHYLEARQTKYPAPTVFCLKRAWSSSPTPLPVMRPTNNAIPPDRRYIFVDNRESAITQHAADFIQHESRILCVMQHVAEQHRVEALIFHRKMAAIVRKIIDLSSGLFADVQPNHRRAQQPLQMMRDEAIAATDVEHVRLRGQHTRDFERHVISSTNLAAPSHAFEATLDRCSQTLH